VFRTETFVLIRCFAKLCIIVMFLTWLCTAQQSSLVPAREDQESPHHNERKESNRARLGRLPIEWLLAHIFRFRSLSNR
jgi:hypothetical protein